MLATLIEKGEPWFLVGTRERRERGRFVDLTATGSTVRLETYVVGLVFRLTIASFRGSKPMGAAAGLESKNDIPRDRR